MIQIVDRSKTMGFRTAPGGGGTRIAMIDDAIRRCADIQNPGMR